MLVDLFFTEPQTQGRESVVIGKNQAGSGSREGVQCTVQCTPETEAVIRLKITTVY